MNRKPILDFFTLSIIQWFSSEQMEKQYNHAVHRFVLFIIETPFQLFTIHLPTNSLSLIFISSYLFSWFPPPPLHTSDATELSSSPNVVNCYNNE